MRINYVIPCWSGLRRVIDPAQEKDFTHYLKSHLNQLQKLEHNLSQITLVINHNLEEPWLFTRYIDCLPAKIKETPLVVVRRDSNHGFTFGAWSYVYDLYGDQFDYYLFGEDDYAPTLPFFGEVLAKQLEAASNRRAPACGFLSAGPVCLGMAADSELITRYNLPMFAIGIASERCLAKVKEIHGRIPFQDSDKYADIDQGTCFHVIAKSGFRICGLTNGDGIAGYISGHKVGVLLHHEDTTDREFRESGRLAYYGNAKGKTIFMPVQHL